MGLPIGIDYTAALTQRGGIGRYTRELISALAQEDRDTLYRLFAAGFSVSALPSPPGANFTWAPSSWSPRRLAWIWHRLQLPLPIERWTGPIKVLHAPDFTLPPTRPGTRTILTVHDLSFVREPTTFPSRLLTYLNKVVPRSAARSDRILADSESTRRDLLDVYNVPPEKVHVLYSGVDDRFYPITDPILTKRTLAHYGIGGEPYIFTIGTIQPRKNYERLVEAVHRLNWPDLHLVIAGAKGWLESPLYQWIAQLGMQERVRFLGFVPDEDLPVLYSSAQVFAFPSLYEGFGLPPLEAMACGTPIVVSNRSSLPEVVGDAGLQVDPIDVDAIADALSRVINDSMLRRNLINKGQIRVQRFSWRSAARQLLQHYAELMQ